MTAFRLLMVAVIVAVGAYTVPVLIDHGLTLYGIFFGDIAAMGWPGQFNVDFLAMLVMSAVYVGWREGAVDGHVGRGLVLGLLAFNLGAPFLAGYLLWKSRGRTRVREVLVG